MQINLMNLKKTYHSADGSIAAVDGISLNIPENKIFGIIGKSGAGKSSLVRLISLLEAPDEGSVYYNHNRVDNLSKKELIAQRRKLGMIFQNFNLFSSRNAAQNIAYPMEISGYPKHEIKARVEEMLKLVGLEGRGDAPISTLSGGQKQRIAIARALSTRPDILFCDEATSALDPETTRSILQLIREIQAKMNLTVVMITHQMEVVRDACEYVAVVEAGKVVEQGLVAEIFANPQTETTKTFLANIAKGDNGRKDKEFARWSSEGGKYTLHFIDEGTGSPVISQVCKKFDVDINIRAGGIEHLPQQDVGTMVVDITGANEEVEKALEFFNNNGVKVTKEE
ncbi:MAG: methionine ABC transporter ATP-binding protein [Treponema sp.]|nr:methionine ABC transporter ATP-binding protein [Treponema sp.]